MTNYYRSPDNKAPEVDLNDDGRSELGRRDFLKAAGFTVAAVAVAGCQRPLVERAIPYAIAPEEIVPGRAYWMASTCHGCAARCGVLVRCRDGRPVKLEGNPDHPLSRGGLCAVGQASILGLYDSQRLGAPQLNGKATDWKSVDDFVNQKLVNARKVRVVSSTLASPTSNRVIDEFLAHFEDGKHVVYDVPSASAIADAHQQTHGVRAIPHYAFDKADVIVSLDADFLGTWISPVEFTKAWSSRRKADGMSWHAQLEPRMSLTGSNADQRLRIHPDEMTAVLAFLAGKGDAPSRPEVLARIRQRLVAGRSLVVCGSNRIEDQLLTNAINEQLGNYGSTLFIDRPSYQREGNDADLRALEAELSSVDALFVLDANPVYDLTEGEAFAKALVQVPLVVTFATHFDETSKFAHAICPEPHYLESWSDSEPVAGVYSVTQPAIAPLRATRQAIESLAAWSGKPAKAYDLVRATNLAANWEQTLNDGFAAIDTTPSVVAKSTVEPVVSARTQRTASQLALVLYPSAAMLDGRHAHNAWLHELPDPVSKVTWDNYASLSPETAKRIGVSDGDIVRVANGNDAVELPAFVQPGQHDGVVAIALGYGRLGTDRFSQVGPKWILRRTYLAPGEAIGHRVVQLARYDGVTVAKTGRNQPLATTQLHGTIDGDRPSPVREAIAQKGQHEQVTLWPAKSKGAHQWAMSIDLAKCTGCSGCVIGCQAENNVPVVGRDEVVREREMHWIRIDRYYSGSGDDVKVAHQPMMCHHCGNAPCETVCPVLATVHSSDGLNQQVYNRCVGTRYCANNCPIKTRRFNWFDYPHEDRFANLVLNPDVAVRTRGVMEKCSMCVQRIEEARIEAKQRGVAIPDGAIRTACEQSCPADAIVFGDLNDPKSRISKIRKDPRYYAVLEELNLQPAVGYLTLTRNA